VGDSLVVYYGDKQAMTYDAKVSYSNTLKIYFENLSDFNNIVLYT